jgi:hypothetical protein
MTSPASGASLQKTFWNTYAFNPFVADTRTGAVGYAGLSILMFMVAPFWGHGLLYLFVRMPFKAKQKEFMTEAEAAKANRVDRAVAAWDPSRDAKANLEEQQKAFIARNQQLHHQLQTLNKRRSDLSPEDYNKAQAEISDAIIENMKQLGAITRQIAEYERSSSPLSSKGEGVG